MPNEDNAEANHHGSILQMLCSRAFWNDPKANIKRTVFSREFWQKRHHQWLVWAGYSTYAAITGQTYPGDPDRSDIELIEAVCEIQRDNSGKITGVIKKQVLKETLDELKLYMERNQFAAKYEDSLVVEDFAFPFPDHSSIPGNDGELGLGLFSNIIDSIPNEFTDRLQQLGEEVRDKIEKEGGVCPGVVRLRVMGKDLLLILDPKIHRDLQKHIFFDRQSNSFTSKYFGINTPVTARTHQDWRRPRGRLLNLLSPKILHNLPGDAIRIFSDYFNEKINAQQNKGEDEVVIEDLREDLARPLVRIITTTLLKKDFGKEPGFDDFVDAILSELDKLKSILNVRPNEVGNEKKGRDYIAQRINEAWTEFLSNDDYSHDRQLERLTVDEVLSAVSAGLDTTKAMMITCLMELQKNPQWYDKICDEIMTACRNGKLFGKNGLSNLQLTNMFIWEVMRKDSFIRASLKLSENPFILRDPAMDKEHYIGSDVIWISLIDKFAEHPDLLGDDSDLNNFNPERVPAPDAYYPVFGGDNMRRCPGELQFSITIKSFFVQFFAEFEISDMTHEELVGPLMGEYKNPIKFVYKRRKNPLDIVAQYNARAQQDNGMQNNNSASSSATNELYVTPRLFNSLRAPITNHKSHSGRQHSESKPRMKAK